MFAKNLEQEASSKEIFDGLEARGIQVDILVNNAGYGHHGSWHQQPVENDLSMLRLNVEAVLRLSKFFVPKMVGRGSGILFNTASVAGFEPGPTMAVYHATKAFILNLSQGLAKEVGGKGVRVQAVLPGMTRTEIWERSGKDVNAFPPEWVMEAGDLVDAALLGFDRGETVTIPPLADEDLYRSFEAARAAMGPHLSKREVAPRYRGVEAVA